MFVANARDAYEEGRWSVDVSIAITDCKQERILRADSSLSPPLPVDAVHPARDDANLSHTHAWNASLATGKRRIFDPDYGNDHLSLYNLARHPKYQRRGVGTMLCEWGMARTKEQGKAVTLFASSMGEQMYRRLGFREIGVVT